MGKLNAFIITFSNPYGIYYPGTMVQGQLNIQLSDAMKMRGLRILIRGEAKNHWTEHRSYGSGKNRRTETIHYRASETYLNHEILLFGQLPSQGRDQVELHQGEHTFPFHFQLPPSLPSSFEGRFGKVRYYVKATIDKPWKFDHTCKAAFTVIAQLDLNREPSATSGGEASNQKMLCCCCCKTGPISGRIQVDRRGYVPGETITFNAEISNISNRKMKDTSVYLKMVSIFTGRSTRGTKHRFVTTKLAKVSRGEILEGGSDSYNNMQLVIPPVPPSRLDGCNIINIQYALELEVNPRGPAFDLLVPVEVIIGTIPLQSFVQQYPPLPQGPPPMGASALPMVAWPEPPPTNLPPNMPPPSYSECIWGKSNITDEDDSSHTRGNLEFAPYYTWYDWGHRPAELPPDAHSEK